MESLITRPATTTHVGLTAEQREAAGVSDSLVRFSVGIEDIADLIADFKQGLAAAEAADAAAGGAVAAVGRAFSGLWGATGTTSS